MRNFAATFLDLLAQPFATKEDYKLVLYRKHGRRYYRRQYRRMKRSGGGAIVTAKAELQSRAATKPKTVRCIPIFKDQFFSFCKGKSIRNRLFAKARFLIIPSYIY